jgi:hypothetical protein
MCLICTLEVKSNLTNKEKVSALSELMNTKDPMDPEFTHLWDKWYEVEEDDLQNEQEHI